MRRLAILSQPMPHPSQTTIPHGCGWHRERGMALPRSLQEGPHLYMPDATASALGLQSWLVVHTAPSFPYPWRETDSSGDPPSYAGGPRELEEPRPITEAVPLSLSRYHLGASRKGRAWEYVPPRGWMGSSVPSALMHREAAFHHPGEPRTRGAGLPSLDRVLGPCLQARQGRNGVPTPTLHRHCGERRSSGQPLPEATSACMEGETKSASGRGPGRGMAASVPTSVQPLVFSLNAGSL